MTRASQGDYAVPEMSLTLGMGQPTATYHDSKRGLGMVASLHSRSVGTIHPAMPLTAGGVNSLWADGISLLEFPRESLHFVEKLGEGQFGEVCIARFLFLGIINRIADLFCWFYLRAVINRCVHSLYCCDVGTPV